jgi:hypothetical protein
MRIRKDAPIVLPPMPPEWLLILCFGPFVLFPHLSLAVYWKCCGLVDRFKEWRKQA